MTKVVSGSGDAAEVSKLLDRVVQLAAAVHTERAEESVTRARLNKHGLDDAEIERQLDTLKWNTAPNKMAPITTYSYLHGLQHLDAIGPAGTDSSAAAILALFRAADICLFTLGTLSGRMLASLNEGRIPAALSHARWRGGFQQLLYRLGLLLVEMNSGAAAGDGAFLSIEDSPAYQRYRAECGRLHDWLRCNWSENDVDVFGRDIDDPKRAVSFHEFVNTGDERVWRSLFGRVQLPGVAAGEGDSSAAFYARTVASEELGRMLDSMETEAETDLLPFRVVHQITEVVAAVANTQVCEAVKELLTAGDEEEKNGGAGLAMTLRRLTVSNRLLSAADESIKLMQRTLTPHGYSSVRPNLGMVRGTSSVVLRKTLFNSTYPLLVRAFKLRLMQFSGAGADSDEQVCEQGRQLMRAGESLMGGILRQVVVLHQHVRTWRDNHIQLPKTHLGVSETAERPTVSLSGSDSAVDIAHDLRQVHAADPITPLCQALLGTAPPGVHEMLTPGGFDEHMAHSTARAVHQVYSEVQERFYRRCPMRHLAAGNGGGSDHHD